MNLQMIFGSTSDKDKVLPGIQKFTQEHPEVVVDVHWASADNTPEKVRKIMEIIASPVLSLPYAFISGAGMSNVLSGFVKQYTDIHDLNIGVPISDSATGGLSAILSTNCFFLPDLIRVYAFRFQQAPGLRVRKCVDFSA